MGKGVALTLGVRGGLVGSPSSDSAISTSLTRGFEWPEWDAPRRRRQNRKKASPSRMIPPIAPPTLAPMIVEGGVADDCTSGGGRGEVLVGEVELAVVLGSPGSGTVYLGCS